MSYTTHAQIAGNGAVRLRVAACASQEGELSPKQWADQNIWSLIGSDWIAAWASAEAASPGENHGENQGCITDGMILASVQAAVTGP